MMTGDHAPPPRDRVPGPMSRGFGQVQRQSLVVLEAVPERLSIAEIAAAVFGQPPTRPRSTASGAPSEGSTTLASSSPGDANPL